MFLEKIGDDKTLEVLFDELLNMNMQNKEKVNDFNVRFLSLKKKSYIFAY